MSLNMILEKLSKYESSVPQIKSTGKNRRSMKIGLHPGQHTKYVIQKHNANRAGLHYDLRIHDPKEDTAHSWALRKLPNRKGVWAIRQPGHYPGYMNFSGVIESGYGAGKVRRLTKNDKVKILSSGDDFIDFEVISKRKGVSDHYHMKRYSDKFWKVKKVVKRKGA